MDLVPLQERPLLRPAEASALYGVPLPRMAVWTRTGVVPSVVVGRSVYIPRAELDRQFAEKARERQRELLARRNGGAVVEEPAPAPPPVEEERVGGFKKPAREPIVDRAPAAEPVTELSVPNTLSGL